MKSIEVVAAIIIGGEKIFATQRGYGEFKEGGNFLVREIKEELDTEIEVGKLVETVEYDYPEFHLTMHCFFCRIRSGNLTLREHEAAKWLLPEELDSVDWLPADLGLIEKLKSLKTFSIF